MYTLSTLPEFVSNSRATGMSGKDVSSNWFAGNIWGWLWIKFWSQASDFYSLLLNSILSRERPLSANEFSTSYDKNSSHRLLTISTNGFVFIRPSSFMLVCDSALLQATLQAFWSALPGQDSILYIWHRKANGIFPLQTIQTSPAKDGRVTLHGNLLLYRLWASPTARFNPSFVWGTAIKWIWLGIRQYAQISTWYFSHHSDIKSR